MSDSNVTQSPQNARLQIIEVIRSTPAGQIASLDFVRDRFIQNYNACNPDKQGELMYHKQMIHFNQIIAGSEKLQQCDRFSLYACFATAAANGYSLDPADNTVYLIPKGGKACLWRQAGAHIHRLIRSNQISRAEQVQIVYKGDDFLASKGRVIKHNQAFASDEMICAYQEFVLPDGLSRFFIYSKFQWADWRAKSDVPNGDNWNWKSSGQPESGFLKTKVTKHAATEKVWATGMQPIAPDSFQDVEIESDSLTVPSAGQDFNEPAGSATPARLETPAVTSTAPAANPVLIIKPAAEPAKAETPAAGSDEEFQTNF